MGDERTWTVFRVDDVWYVANPNTLSFRADEVVECAPASVLEERDRELEVERWRSNGVASHAGYWAKCARESALEAEQLRSQLTEARARWPEIHARIGDLRGMCTDELPHEQLDAKLSELDDLLYEGLVPAPQDREPTT